MQRKKKSEFTECHLSEANSKNGTKISDTVTYRFYGKKRKFSKISNILFFKFFNKANIMHEASDELCFLDISKKLKPQKNSNLKENPEKLKQNSERTQKPATCLFYCKSSFTIFFLL